MGKWYDMVMKDAEELVIVWPEHIGTLMASREIFAEGISARNNSAKVLKGLSDLRKLEYVNGAYRIPGCKSEGGDHAKSLTESLVKIKVKFPNALINREKTIPVGLRPDAMVLARLENRGLCFVLEQTNNETKEQFQRKVNIWNGWPDALPFLSNLFGYKIPGFTIIRSDSLDKFLEGL